MQYKPRSRVRTRTQRSPHHRHGRAVWVFQQACGPGVIEERLLDGHSPADSVASVVKRRSQRVTVGADLVPVVPSKQGSQHLYVMRRARSTRGDVRTQWLTIRARVAVGPRTV